jgi:hypothetical protein
MERKKAFLISGMAMRTIEHFYRTLFASRTERNGFGLKFKPILEYVYASGNAIQALSSEASKLPAARSTLPRSYAAPWRMSPQRCPSQ